jgi:OOP family OmpA-OmpF porin
MKNRLFSKGVNFGFVITLLATTGCAEYHKRVLHNTEERGCEFTRTLALEYEGLGKAEQEQMYNESSADYFYLKAICAKEGNCVGPTTLEKWDIDEDKLPELQKARDHLVRLLSLGARDIAPEMAAHAQTHFDCWVEQQSEGWQKHDIAWCRAEFYKAISDVELKLMGGIHHVRPQSMVLFENNSSHLTQEAVDVIDNVAHQEKTLKNHRRILLVGRTDKIGDLKHNKELSKHRAMAVKKALIHDGVPAHLISIKAAGETPGPEVDAHNRRVDIIFLEHKK